MAERAYCVNPDPGMDHFGVCPECGRTDGFLNVGRNHWFVCHEHTAAWWVGGNLFSSWKDEDEDDWLANEALLLGYVEVEPLHDLEDIAAVLEFRPQDFLE